MNDQLGIISALMEEGEASVNEGDTDTDILKSFINIESQMCRRSERLANKNKDKSGYFTFVPELDFNLRNPMAFSSRLDNETYTFREMLKQPDASDFVCAMDKEISTHELHDRWEIVPRNSTNGKKVLKSI